MNQCELGSFESVEQHAQPIGRSTPTCSMHQFNVRPINVALSRNNGLPTLPPFNVHLRMYVASPKSDSFPGQTFAPVPGHTRFMADPISPIPLGSWTRSFASALMRLYPTTEPADAIAIAHGRFFVDEGMDPVEAAELYALAEGHPSLRRGLVSQEGTTFRSLVERFMSAEPGPQAFKQLARDSNDLVNADARNEDIHAGVRAIAVRHVKDIRAGVVSDEAIRLAHWRVLRALFRLLIALSVDPPLRARTLIDVLNEFDA